MDRTCAISVDLDATRFYRSIHGMDQVSVRPDPVLELAPRRLGDWANALGIPLTWFVVGRDLDDDGYARTLSDLHRRGHELANHSLDHYYDLSRRERDVMREQIREGSARLSRLTQHEQHGFRAPGYTMSDELYDVLTELRVAYDSSVFPCPLYYGAKTVALFGQRLAGRRSHAILDSTAILFARTSPYRMGRRYLDLGSGLLEFPIQVTPGLRLPFIGTTLTLLGRNAASVLARGVARLPFVNLELHGIDAIDRDDGLEELGKVQPDLRIPWRRKLETLSSVVNLLRRRGCAFVTLAQCAAKFD